MYFICRVRERGLGWMWVGVFPPSGTSQDSDVNEIQYFPMCSVGVDGPHCGKDMTDPL